MGGEPNVDHAVEVKQPRNKKSGVREVVRRWEPRTLSNNGCFIEWDQTTINKALWSRRHDSFTVLVAPDPSYAHVRTDYLHTWTRVV